MWFIHCASYLTTVVKLTMKKTNKLIRLPERTRINSFEPINNVVRLSTIPKPHTVVGRLWKLTSYLKSKLYDIKQSNQYTTPFSYLILSL